MDGSPPGGLFDANTLVADRCPLSDRRFHILTLVDDFTRECLALVVDTSLTAGLQVAREFVLAWSLHGKAGCSFALRSDLHRLRLCVTVY